MRTQMERQAINFVVQASACDIMKVAMERVHQALDRMFPFDFKSKCSPAGSPSRHCSVSVRPTPLRPVSLVLQIHDELIFEIERGSRTDDIVQVIRHEMSYDHHLSLALPVQVKAGDNWESMV